MRKSILLVLLLSSCARPGGEPSRARVERDAHDAGVSSLDAGPPLITIEPRASTSTSTSMPDRAAEVPSVPTPTVHVASLPAHEAVAPDAGGGDTIADAGADAVADAGGRQTEPDGSSPFVAPELPPGSDSGAVEPGDALSPMDAGLAQPSAPDVGSRPPELVAYVDYLDSHGFSPCSQLEWAVDDCCSAHGGEAFACSQSGCSCEGTSAAYPTASALCTIAPAVPLRWGCP